MSITIREVGLNDYEEIYSLNVQLGFSLPKDAVKERLSVIKQSEKAIIFVADDNEKVVGYVHGSASDRVYDDRLFLIHTIIIDKKYRSKGIGHDLITEIEAWAKKNNYIEVGLWSRIDRVVAHKFYEKHKYINERTQKYYLKSL